MDEYVDILNKIADLGDSNYLYSF